MWGNLKEKLGRTREVLKLKLGEAFRTGGDRDEALLRLEEALLLADAGPAVTEKVLDGLRRRSRKNSPPAELENMLREEIQALFPPPAARSEEMPNPYVLLMVGANGGGKTTSAAKLAFHYQGRGRSVLLAASDTFRAAAQEQLSLWGRRLGIPVVHGQYGADPAAVVFDALQSLKARRLQVLIVDTAGRLHTSHNLMNELEKIRRVVSREVSGAPHEAFLVLDAGIGQNALVQAREFTKFTGLTGVFLSKLDGTARGGSVLGIAEELRLPIKFVGTGEGETDLQPFSPAEFVDALLS